VDSKTKILKMTNDVLLVFSNIFTAVAGWYVGKRKVSAETDNIVLKNLENSVLIYSQIIDDLKREIEGLNKKIQELEHKIDELHEENKRLKSSL
jgi:peptidoglycan hydrolase CwlO-like protein